ncbi:hypothetical protein ACFL2Q_02825 [Thermodesulfobacteriota bacterium]
MPIDVFVVVGKDCSLLEWNDFRGQFRSLVVVVIKDSNVNPSALRVFAYLTLASNSWIKQL